MLRFFRIVLGALAMIAVALISALLTMRYAIHGTEVAVPNLAGLTVAEASGKTFDSGLSINVENSFYSTTVPVGRILGQSPAAGVKVRREWRVRVTQSLGPQRVAIPNVVGQQEREAAIGIRHVGLDLGTVAHLPGVGTAAGVVLAQTPPPNAAGVDRPLVSLLLSDPENTPPQAYIMPELVGLSYAQASAMVTDAGLRILSLEDVPVAIPAVAAQSATGMPAPPAAPTPRFGTIVAQSPGAGHRIVSGEGVRLSVAR